VRQTETTHGPSVGTLVISATPKHSLRAALYATRYTRLSIFQYLIVIIKNSKLVITTR
jgi:hypothetical protein